MLKKNKEKISTEKIPENLNLELRKFCSIQQIAIKHLLCIGTQITFILSFPYQL